MFDGAGLAFFHTPLLHLLVVTLEIWWKLIAMVARNGLIADLFPDSQNSFRSNKGVSS